MKCFEAQHLFGDPLDEMMILFKDVVQVFDLQDFDQLAIALDFQDGIDVSGAYPVAVPTKLAVWWVAFWPENSWSVQARAATREASGGIRCPSLPIFSRSPR